MKKNKLKQLIKEEILSILNERSLSNKLGLDFKAKKLAKQITSILDRIEQDPKYIESKRLFDSGERKFEDIVRKELLTPEEHKIFDEIVNDSRYGTTDYEPIFRKLSGNPQDPTHKVGRSNVMKRAIDMGLNVYGFGSTDSKNTSYFDEFKY